MSDDLTSLVKSVAADPGLQSNISDRKIAKGVAAAETLSSILLDTIDRTDVNDDGLLTAREMAKISRAVYADPAKYVQFLEAHGNDNGDVVSGFHHVQGDGGTLIFQGRKFIDTVADAIFHFGFKVTKGRYVNEDGASNETTVDVAGWLNYFLNGKNVVFGSDADDYLGTGIYSGRFKAANDEYFYGGDGADRIWGGDGKDRIFGESGSDICGGGDSNDRIYGGLGRDRLNGDAGQDFIWGGPNNDTINGGNGSDQLKGGPGDDYLSGGPGGDKMWGGDKKDTMYGGDDNDRIFGDLGRDRLNGDAGQDFIWGGPNNDTINGGNGSDQLKGGPGDDYLNGGNDADKMWGGNGDDKLSGGAGRDKLVGGPGRDVYQLWESKQFTDTIVIKSGDSGRVAKEIDYIEGFNTEHDRIDLRSFGDMKFTELDFIGKGKASAYYDGRYLRIDEDGDRATDMMLEFRYVGELTADNFLL